MPGPLRFSRNVRRARLARVRLFVLSGGSRSGDRVGSIGEPDHLDVAARSTSSGALTEARELYRPTRECREGFTVASYVGRVNARDAAGRR